MNIIIQNLKLTNFKGVRSLDVNFKNLQGIYGKNRTGKTTIVDSFMWLLFGKDSTDRKDFEIKTLDSNNNVIPNIDHEVNADIMVENAVITLRKCMREKWVKTRGSSVSEFQGNETLYFWNDVPCKQSEYQAKVSGIIDEAIFKLITNPLYFNTMMTWQSRRQTLFSLAPAVSNHSVLDSIATVNNKTQIAQLEVMLNMGKSLLEYKKEIAVKKKKLKDELLLIPSRIDECNRSMPEELNWPNIEHEIKSLVLSKSSLNAKKDSQQEALRDSSTAALEKQRELNSLKAKLDGLLHDLTRDRNASLRQLNDAREDANHQRSTALFNIDALATREEKIHATIESLEKANADLRASWAQVNERTIEVLPEATQCPSCRRELEYSESEGIVAKLKANFNISKASELASISANGKNNTTAIQRLKEELTTNVNASNVSQATLFEANQIITSLTDKIAQTQNLPIIETSEVISLRAQIDAFVIPVNVEVDYSDINTQIKALEDDINSYRSKLSQRDIIAKTRARIAELMSNESNMAQELADLENYEFAIDAFNKNKIDRMVEAINSKFKFVKFKLFNTQINGGLEECCDALIDGVPFSDANTASKVNAGLDIINAICEHHNVYAPIFIDNRESVNELLFTKSQVINLFVTTTDEKLRFELNQTQTL